MNMNSTFTWSGHTEEDRQKAMEEEFKFLLLRMRWDLGRRIPTKEYPCREALV